MGAFVSCSCVLPRRKDVVYVVFIHTNTQTHKQTQQTRKHSIRDFRDGNPYQKIPLKFRRKLREEYCATDSSTGRECTAACSLRRSALLARLVDEERCKAHEPTAQGQSVEASTEQASDRRHELVAGASPSLHRFHFLWRVANQSTLHQQASIQNTSSYNFCAWSG
jgi:hypothetical protein